MALVPELQILGRLPMGVQRLGRDRDQVWRWPGGEQEGFARAWIQRLPQSPDSAGTDAEVCGGFFDAEPLSGWSGSFHGVAGSWLMFKNFVLRRVLPGLIVRLHYIM